MRVAALYALAGFTSLASFVVGSRIGIDRFGATALTFLLVAVFFVTGHATGVWAGRGILARLAERVASPLRRYGAIELAIAAAALVGLAAAIWIPIEVFGAFPYTLRDGLWEPKRAVQLTHVGLMALWVGVPCFWMGVRFLALGDAFVETSAAPALPPIATLLGASLAFVGVWAAGGLLALDPYDAIAVLVGMEAALGCGFWMSQRHAASSRGAHDADRMEAGSAPSAVSLLMWILVAALGGGALEADAFRFDRFATDEVATDPDPTAALAAHFPLLAHPAPKDVLVIGHGAGDLVSAVALHDSVERIDVVGPLRSAARRSAADARVRSIVDDGRHFLAVSALRYDFITSAPPAKPPHASAHRLTSRESYRAARAHLTDDGLIAQRMPLERMTPRAVERVIRTFLDVFPHTLVYGGVGEELVLVGSLRPISLASIEERFATSERVAEHLAHFGVPSAASLLARLIRGDASLRRRYADDPNAPRVRDWRGAREPLYLEHADPPGAVAFDPLGVLEELADEGLASEPLLREVMIHLGRVRHHARGFPVSALVALRETGGEGALLRDVAWEEVAGLEAEAEAQRARGELDAARDTLHRALALSRAQPRIWAALASIERDLGNRAAAVEALRRFLAIEPQDDAAQRTLAQLEE